MAIWDRAQWSAKVSRERLSTEEIDQLESALREWASHHPLRKLPLLYLDQHGSITAPDVSKQGLTPLDIARALKEEDSPFHEPVLRLFEVGLSCYAGSRQLAVREVVEAFVSDIEEWAASSG